MLRASMRNGEGPGRVCEGTVVRKVLSYRSASEDPEMKLLGSAEFPDFGA